MFKARDGADPKSPEPETGDSEGDSSPDPNLDHLTDVPRSAPPVFFLIHHHPCPAHWPLPVAATTYQQLAILTPSTTDFLLGVNAA